MAEKIVEAGGLAALPEGVVPPPVYAPPIRFSSSASPAAETAEQALQRLAELRQKDLISEEEYQEKRRAIIDKL